MVVPHDQTQGAGVGQVARGKVRHIKRMHVQGGWWALGLAGAAQVPGFVALFAARRSSFVTAVDCTVETIAAELEVNDNTVMYSINGVCSAYDAFVLSELDMMTCCASHACTVVYGTSS